MTPDPSFVADLRSYDRTLRLRWGRHREKWVIEKKVRERQPDWLGEQPNPLGRSLGAKDLWDGWVEGYVHVLTVPRELLSWNLVVEHLHRQNMQAQGGIEAINRRLDAEVEAEEKAADRDIANFCQTGALDLHDRIAWHDGRRVSAYDPDPLQTYEQADGFRIYDRRQVKA